jgi:DNA repair protein RadD
MKLRPYQEEAIKQTRKFLSKNDKALIVAGTGSGKSVINAELIYLAAIKNKKILQLVHTKELVDQNSKEFANLCNSRNVNFSFSICCSGLGKPCTNSNIVFASPQTFVNRMNNTNYDLIIIDECDRIPSSENSIYRKILSNYNGKVIGMTATPYRENNTPIYNNDGFFDGISYKISAKELTEQGYLTPFQYIKYNNQVHIDTDSIKVKKNGSYIEESHANAFKNFYKETCEFTLQNTAYHKKVMIFCVNIDHAQTVAKVMGISHVVHSKLTKKERDDIIYEFKHSISIKYIINVGILTIGFNVPSVDCIVLMRAIQSAPLYLQIIGRAQRLSKNKEFFNIIDFGNNISRFKGIYDDDVFNNISPAGNSFYRDINEEDKIVSENAIPKDIKCKVCSSVIQSQDIQCMNCGLIIKNNLSIKPHTPEFFEENVLNIRFKLTKSKKGYDMYVINIVTNSRVVPLFITLTGGYYKVKKDRDILKKLKINCYSIAKLKQIILDQNYIKPTRIKYLKNDSGYYDVIDIY